MVINKYQRNLPNLQINWLVWFMVFNTTFNNISVMSWPSVLLVEETRVPGDNHWPVASHWQTLSHNVVMSTPWARLESTALVVIGTDSTGSWISNYHTIMTMTPPPNNLYADMICHLSTLFMSENPLWQVFTS